MEKLISPLRSFMNGGLVLFRLFMVKLAPKSRQPDNGRKGSSDRDSNRPGDYA